jgi:hypothetical protein
MPLDCVRGDARVSVLEVEERRGTSTSPGHARTVFKRALQRDHLLVAEATAKEIGRKSLVEALELTP